MSERQLTGRHVAIITVSAFAIIIGVNLTLAWNAVATFPGLEVKNSYVASQSFNENRRAQEALGWDSGLTYDGSTLALTLDGPDGFPAAPTRLDAVLGRPTHVADDVVPAFAFDGARWTAPMELAPGYWDLRLVAEAADGTEFRQRLEIFVRPGS